jgi:hypothetical protein
MSLAVEAGHGLLVGPGWPGSLRPHDQATRSVCAWFGLTVDAAADLSESSEYNRLEEQARYQKAVDEQISLLAHLLSAESPVAVDLRWTVAPNTRSLSLSVLGKAWGRDEAGARSAALAARRALASGTPDHVYVSPIESADEVAETLRPWQPAPAGLIEVRKRIATAEPNRPDAGVAYYLAVLPFSLTAAPWNRLLAALAEHPSPLILSVGLTPVSLPPSFSVLLERSSTHYGRLAREGELRDSGVYFGNRKLAPDSFAIEAEKIFADAARRYRDVVFALRIQLASPAPIEDGLARLVGSTISPPSSESGKSYLDTAFAGAAFQIERPRTTAEQQTFVHNLFTLDHQVWGGDPAIWARPDPPHPHLRALSLIADTRETACAFRLPIAGSGRLPGFPVRKPGFGTRVFSASAGPSISLGRQLVGGVEVGEIELPTSSLPKHALFVGTTGSGKTTSVLSFLRELWLTHHVPFLVIEPVNSDHDDYRALLECDGFEQMALFTCGDEASAPFRLNPFAVPTGVLVREHQANLLACFKAAFGLFDPLPHIYQRALAVTYERHGLLPANRIAGGEEMPVLSSFVQAMNDVTDDLEYGGDVRANIIAASRVRAESLAMGACADTLSGEHSYPIDELLRRPVLIELKELGAGDEQALVIALVLNAMTEHYQANRQPRGGLAHVTVIEEAHRLLSASQAPSGATVQGDAKGQAAEALANTLAENRKYGEAVVIVEQIPSKLVSDTFKNTNLKVLHRLAADEDRELIGETMHLDDDQKRYAATLAPGEAIVYHDELDKPALVRVVNIRPELPEELPSRARIAERFRELLSESPEFEHALVPFPDCAPCRFKCEFRTSALTLARGENLAKFKEILADYGKAAPADRGREGARLLSITAELGDRFARFEGPRREDFDACLFIHLMHSVKPGASEAWSNWFRSQNRNPMSSTEKGATHG